LGSWIDRGDIYSYSDIWILTLKRIYAEGLQQRRRKKEIGIWRVKNPAHRKGFSDAILINGKGGETD